jgi:hypothetical protein
MSQYGIYEFTEEDLKSNQRGFLTKGQCEWLKMVGEGDGPGIGPQNAVELDLDAAVGLDRSDIDLSVNQRR